jgi:hypothetical protein
MAEIIGTGYQRSGKNSRVEVNSSVLTQSKWEANLKGDDLDTANFQSEGLNEGIVGFIGAEWSCGGNWDANQNSFEDPPGFYPRDNLQNLLFYTNVADAVYWAFPYARVRSATNGAEAKGLVTFQASGMNQGNFYAAGVEASAFNDGE